MRTWRILLCVSGILLGLFGVLRLLTQVPAGNLVVLAVWLIAAVVIHDGLLSPAVLAVGWALARVIPPRARRYVQAALIAGGLIVAVTIPLILRAGKQPDSKALLRQNFGGNLTILLGLVAAVSLAPYAVRVARDRATDPGEHAERSGPTTGAAPQ